MRNVLLLAMILVLNTVSYAKLGRHNLQINVGGGYQANFTQEILTLGSTPSGSLVWGTEPRYTLGGGAFTVEVGYLLHSVRQSGIIHGFDLRGDFTMSFLNATVLENIARKVTQDTTKMFGGFAMTYTLGRQLKSGRLMFDILGFGAIFGTTDTSQTATFVAGVGLPDVTSDLGKTTGLGMQYVLPGVQFIMNNGLTIGWRNKFKLFFGGDSAGGMFAIETLVSIGYTFGGGKQPWEN